MSGEPRRWHDLSNKQKRLVERYIETLLRERVKLDEVIEKPGREIVDRQIRGGVCLQLEKVKCGKEGCKCGVGELHGPYWYAYWREGGKLRSKYIGKKLPNSYVTDSDSGSNSVT